MTAGREIYDVEGVGEEAAPVADMRLVAIYWLAVARGSVLLRRRLMGALAKLFGVWMGVGGEFFAADAIL